MCGSHMYIYICIYVKCSEELQETANKLMCYGMVGDEEEVKRIYNAKTMTKVIEDSVNLVEKEGEVQRGHREQSSEGKTTEDMR